MPDRRKPGSTHLQHLVPLPQGLLNLSELELQDAVCVPLPLKLLQEEAATPSITLESRAPHLLQ